MLKYVDLYRYSDGVALIGHRHSRTGPPQLRPCAPHASFAERGRYKAGPIVHGGEGARPHASMPCFVVPWTLQSINRHTRCSRPLGYELTSRGLTSPPASQTCRSRRIARPRHLVTFHAISAVAPRFVPKSVPKTARRNCSSLGVSRWSGNAVTTSTRSRIRSQCRPAERGSHDRAGRPRYPGPAARAAVRP
jgi:hypothetical protein